AADYSIRNDQQVSRQHRHVLPGQAEEDAGRRRQPFGSHAGDVRIADGRLECPQSSSRAAFPGGGSERDSQRAAAYPGPGRNAVRESVSDIDAQARCPNGQLRRQHWRNGVMKRGKLISGLCLSLIGFVYLTALMVAATDTQVADAAMKGNKEAVRSLIKQAADVNAAQGDGMTALHWAALNGDVDIAKMLLYAGANLKATTRLGAYTPLAMAAKAGSS